MARFVLSTRSCRATDVAATFHPLYYGLAQDDRSGLHAHVWVRAGDFDVIGGEIAHRFVILATFPPQNSEPDSVRAPAESSPRPAGFSDLDFIL